MSTNTQLPSDPTISTPSSADINPNSSPSQDELPQESKPANWQPKKRSPVVAVAILALLITGALAILYAWRLPPFTSTTVSTDNAYVRGQTTVISPRISGYVQEVLVGDFATVKKGDALVKIESDPYQAKVAQAEAGLAAQYANIDKVSQGRQSANANLTARQLAIKNAKAQLQLAQLGLSRIESVKNSEGIADKEYDQAKSAVEQAQMALAQAQAQYKVAEQELLGVKTSKTSTDAGIASAKAVVDLAKQELAHTVVYAPADGKLGEVAVKTGQLVSAGTQLMALVPQNHWVIANFKETDISRIGLGQPATITVDALNGQRFTGQVSEIAPATTAEFSVIRADAGAGNFVKIAQRIAVKITLNKPQEGLERLAPGMSVVASVDTASKAH